MTREDRVRVWLGTAVAVAVSIVFAIGVGFYVLTDAATERAEHDCEQAVDRREETRAIFIAVKDQTFPNGAPEGSETVRVLDALRDAFPALRCNSDNVPVTEPGA